MTTKNKTSKRHLILRAESEYSSFLIALEVTANFLESTKRRIAMSNAIKEQDDNSSGLGFFFYGFEVYEEGDCEAASYEDDCMQLVDELPENMGELQRRDYGQLHVKSDGCLHIEFGIKHVSESYHTGFFSLEDIDR